MSPAVRACVLEIARAGRRVMDKAENTLDQNERNALAGIGNALILLSVGIQVADERGGEKADPYLPPPIERQRTPAVSIDDLLPLNSGQFAPRVGKIESLEG